MSPHTQRLIWWGLAIAVTFIYIVLWILHWTHVIGFPQGLSTFYVPAVLVMSFTGYVAETKFLRIRDDADHAPARPSQAPVLQPSPTPLADQIERMLLRRDEASS